MAEFLIIFFIAFLISVVSGILGLGGAIFLIPAYLYLPQLFGINPIDIKIISGTTSIQVFASSLMGVLIHRKRGSVHPSLLYTIGIPMTIFALIGALLSHYVEGKYIISVFAMMALAGGILMFTKTDNAESIKDEVQFSKTLALIIAISVGLFGGMVGAPSAFLLSPLMIAVLKIPIRVAIGSTLGIILLTAFSTSIGKIIAGQVDFLLTAYAVLGSLIGVSIGSNLSYKFKAKYLKISLAILIMGIAVEMLYKVFIV